MKTTSLIVILGALLLAGCDKKEEVSAAPNTGQNATSQTSAPAELKAISYDLGSKKKGDKGVCAVCMIKEGKQPAEEEVKVVLDYKGKTYVFCNEAEEAEFISDPKKFAGE